jgi:hypothetical protein
MDIEATRRAEVAIKNQEITDILLVVSYRGLRSPDGSLAGFLRAVQRIVQ